MSPINIAISASSSYVRYARVMMASLYLAHPKSTVNFYIFYIDDGVLRYQVDLNAQSKLHNPLNSVVFIKVDRRELEKVDNGKGWALDLWCRWYSLDMLAQKHDRVLLLGVDTLIRSNIEDFYYQDISGYYFACAPDAYISNTDATFWPKIKADMDRVGLADKKRYVNGDVVLVNLKETKESLSFSKYIDLYYANQFTCWDQDVISYCFPSKIKFQDFRIYNYFPNLGLDSMKDSELIDGVKVMHFAGGPKPWNVAPWAAQNFVGIPEWWNLASKEGYPGLVEYIRYAKQLLRRAIVRAQK